MHESSSLKQVLFFYQINKFWLFINEAMLGLDDSKLKSPSIHVLSYSSVSKSPSARPVHLGNID